VPAWTTPSGGGSGYWVEVTGSAAGTALGVTSGAYAVQNIGSDTPITINSIPSTFTADTTRRITATSNIGSVGGYGGTTYTLRTSNATGAQALFGMAYGNGLFLAVGGSDKNAKSVGGTIWEYVSTGLGTAQTGYQATFGNNLFVVGGSSRKLSTSPDGVTFTLQDLSATFGASDDIYAVGYGNNLYLAGGSDGKLATSTNGTTWTTRTANVSTNNPAAIAYGNGYYVIGCNAIANFTVLTTSTDGTTWTSQNPGGSMAVLGVAYGAGLWVIAGSAGKIRTSPDLTTWTARTSQFGTENINFLKYIDGVFVAVGDNGLVSTSTNGTTWTARTSGFSTSAVYGVAGGDGLIAICGYPDATSGKVATSPSGLSQLLFTPITYSPV
jgi:hypothetical protein